MSTEHELLSVVRNLIDDSTIESENPLVGLILCTDKNKEHVELMQLDNSNIRVNKYLTVLPTQEVLRDKLRQAVEIAQKKLINNKD